MIQPDVIPACQDFVDGVATKDVQIGDGPAWVRIFKPQQPELNQRPLPLVLYSHGGAYCFGDPNWSVFHNFCAIMARISGSVWVSLSYRLAPKHRLPAAFDDGMQALLWLQTQAQASSSASDPWLDPSLVDFSKLFLAGESAGANIALHVAMNAPGTTELLPLSITGLLLIHPGFHTEAKKGTMVDDPTGDVHVDKLYEIALPAGETLDYHPINPVHASAPPLTPLVRYPNILVTAAERDFRYDLTLKFFDCIKPLCPGARLFVTPGKAHVFHIIEPDCPEAHEMVSQLVDFIKSNTDN